MVILNSIPPQLTDVAYERLVREIQDMVDNIKIEPPFRITHPHYQPFELSQEAVDRFTVLPQSLKDKYLGLQLRSFLYGIYYNRWLSKQLTQPNAVDLYLENSTQLGVNFSFYEQLHQVNHGTGYFDPDWQVVNEESDDGLIVRKGGLTLLIQRQQHLCTSEQDATSGANVAVKMPRNLLQNGFYMAVGNAGPQTQTFSESDQQIEPIVRVYFHVTPEGAIACMDQITQRFNPQQIPFSFKVLYNPDDYQRSDTGVLYFSRSQYANIYPLLKQLYEAHAEVFIDEVPLFTKPLAPGLGLAEEPHIKFMEQESFGMNRCQLVANGLLNAHLEGHHSTEQKWSAIAAQFESLGLSLRTPYLNPDSTDCYPVL